jgi:DNA-binding transcriptional LysR family regulator
MSERVMNAMSNTLDIELLQTFVAIADTGGFTRAAAQVHRSQSAISMQMKKLEQVTQRTLFEKDGRGVSLTENGETLLSYARRIIRLQEEAIAAIQKPEMAGAVSIGIPDDYVACFLPDLLTDLARFCPLVQVEVRCEPSEQLIQAITMNEIDLALITEQPGFVTGQMLRSERTVWATSIKYHVHEQEPLPLAVYQKKCFFRDWALSALDEVGRAYRIAYTSPSITGIEAAITSGLAVATLPSSIVCCDMRELTPEEGFPLLPESIISLHRSSRAKGEAVDYLARLVRERLAEPTTIAA